jgi:ferredoxin-NADP reductase
LVTDSHKLIDVVVLSRTQETANIISLELGRPDGRPLPVAEAGSHVDVHLKAASLVRQYSLVGDLRERSRYRIGVLRERKSRGGSIAIHDEAVEGALLQISEPRNNFRLPEGAECVKLLGGGIGITPLVAMAFELKRSAVPFSLHHWTRSEHETPFRHELDAGPLGPWVHRHFGLPSSELPGLLSGPASGCHAMICGPLPFMDHVTSLAAELGWEKGHLHTELFSAPELVEGQERAFTVIARKSGLTLHVAADQTILGVLLENGIQVETSCEVGICGTCITRVLEGQPDHRDEVLNAAEKAANEEIAVCCSRSLSDTLVIDL